jgi:hypothetical protein
MDALPVPMKADYRRSVSTFRGLSAKLVVLVWAATISQTRKLL